MVRKTPFETRMLRKRRLATSPVNACGHRFVNGVLIQEFVLEGVLRPARRPAALSTSATSDGHDSLVGRVERSVRCRAVCHHRHRSRLMHFYRVNFPRDRSPTRQPFPLFFETNFCSQFQFLTSAPAERHKTQLVYRKSDHVFV